MIAAEKRMPGFPYERGKDSLKGWLLSVTRWKVADQFRKREKSTLTPPPGTLSHPMGEGRGEGHAASDATTRTAAIARITDPSGIDLEALWDVEWGENVLWA